MVKECPVSKPCYYCSQKHNHHRSICPKKFSVKEKEPTTLALETDAETRTEQSEHSLLSHDNTVLMQTATATMQNPNNPNLKETVCCWIQEVTDPIYQINLPNT